MFGSLVLQFDKFISKFLQTIESFIHYKACWTREVAMHHSEISKSIFVVDLHLSFTNVGQMSRTHMLVVIDFQSHNDLSKCTVIVIKIKILEREWHSNWKKFITKNAWKSIDLGPTKREFKLLTLQINLHEIVEDSNWELVKNDQELVVIIPHEIHQGTI